MLGGGARLECERTAAGEPHENQGLNVKSSICSAFVLGMMVGVVGLIAVQRTMAGDTTPYLTKNFIVNTAPVKNGVKPMSAAAVANQQGLKVGRSSVTMVEPIMEPFSESAFPSSAGDACSRRNALARAAAVAAAAIGAPAFAAATPVVKMGTDSGQLVFEPSDVTICKGDSVTWVNNKAGPHNVIFNEVPSGVNADSISQAELLGEEGQKFTRKFDVAGAYSYYCEPHGGAGMLGELTVK
jgi:plastocyanin